MIHNTTVTDLGMMYTIREMNNPLTNIMLSLDLLETCADHKSSEYCYDVIKKSTESMRISLEDMYACFLEKYAITNTEELVQGIVVDMQGSQLIKTTLPDHS